MLKFLSAEYKYINVGAPIIELDTPLYVLDLLKFKIGS